MSRNVKLRIQKAVYLLLEGHSSKEVAKLLNARPETLSRWKRHPYFISETQRLKDELCEDMRLKLWRLALNAFEATTRDIQEGQRGQQRFGYALEFFKTIGIEQIFRPQPIQPTPTIPPKRHEDDHIHSEIISKIPEALLEQIRRNKKNQAAQSSSTTSCV